MSEQWYYVQNGAPAGPIGEDALLSLVAKGTVQTTTYVWQVGMPSWRPMREILRLLLPPASPRAAPLTTRKGVEVDRGFLFIVMPMIESDSTLDDVHDAIKETALDLNLSAERVDDVETTDRITHRILESIERAEFIVADLTHGRPNVYYEAGYAHALGKAPIYVARKGTQLEFDVKDYPVIFFNNMQQLKEKLRKRLRALISQRKVQPVIT